MTLLKHGTEIRADLAGYSVPVAVRDGRIAFELPGGRGSFTGRFSSGGEMRGFWKQPRLTTSGMVFLSPVRLVADGEGRWRGEIVPLEDEFTVYLVARPREDGTLGAFLRNPDRNIGRFVDVDRLVRDGDRVELVGKFLEWSRFYARGEHPAPYRYEPPLATDDGWPTARLDDVGIRLEPIRRLIETEIDTVARDVHAPYVHAMLIARHGKLVFEGYFHGFDSDTPHDTRSASKSLTSMLVGAAIESGASIGPDTPVYATLRKRYPRADVSERQSHITVEHLLTISSGLDCEDRDPSSPGNEDVMQAQTEEPDWYRYTLDLAAIREPGERAVYCSANTNLVGAALTTVTGRDLADLFQDGIAEPLGIERYHLNLMPTGEPYMGGGIHWRPRDFLKLGQVMLDGGTWHGKRILPREWVERSIAPLVELRDRRYGYVWWVEEHPYGDRKVTAFYAGGNGGQVLVGVPELGLVVAFFAGNYSDPVLYRIQNEFFPRYVLPAVEK